MAGRIQIVQRVSPSPGTHSRMRQLRPECLACMAVSTLWMGTSMGWNWGKTSPRRSGIGR